MDGELAPTLALDDDHERSVCQSKVRYRTKAVARAARARDKRTYNRTMHIYECPVCRGFHLTKMALEYDRQRRRAASAGELVTISYDAPDGVELALGDGLRTNTGRTYLIVGFRRQETGMHAGRYHLMCAVNQPIPGRTFLLVWYKRDPKPR